MKKTLNKQKRRPRTKEKIINHKNVYQYLFFLISSFVCQFILWNQSDQESRFQVKVPELKEKRKLKRESQGFHKYILSIV